MLPFNIEILVIKSKMLKQLGEVTELAIMETNTKNFNDKGLYSTEIFGPTGSEERSYKFGYIDIGVSILHPLVYKHVTTLKSLYGDIMAGTKYGKWDDNLKDVVLSNSDDGDTGYSWMLEQLPKIQFNTNNSTEREFKVKVVEKYSAKEWLINKWLVLPAGLRDYSVDEDNVPSEDEVNDLYRRLLGTSAVLRTLPTQSKNSPAVDNIRFNIQKQSLALYEHFKTLTDGKKKFIEGKFAKRAITYGTRNVITALPINTTSLKGDDHISFNDTVVGLTQFVSAIAPVTKNKLQTRFINKILNPLDTSANLVDMKSLQTVSTAIDPGKRDEWLSDEGLDGIIGKMQQEVLRNEPVILDGHYLLLVYDNGKVVEPIFNTANITDDMNKKHIRPITLKELFYISIVDITRKYPALVNRYPVADIGGVYLSMLYVKSTSKGRVVDIKIDGQVIRTNEYPVIGTADFNSLSPHPSRISGLGADFAN